jgi:hypothetical protein
MRLSRALCSVVAQTFNGSHATLETLFRSSGVKSEPPDLSHGAKWKEWLFRVGQDQPDESLTILGNLLEEFMDLPPPEDEFVNDDPIHVTPREAWEAMRKRVEQALEDNGLRYFRFGRVLPTGQLPDALTLIKQAGPSKPRDVEEVIDPIVRGLRNAMHPLTHRRKGSTALTFSNEYDVQDLLHALLRPWIRDIRPEEFTPSYAGSSTRMDFLLPAHELVIETKIVRDKLHGKKIGDELTIDTAHYKAHPKCKRLWCVVYDPQHFLTNAEGLKNDLEGEQKSKEGIVDVKVFVLA